MSAAPWWRPHVRHLAPGCPPLLPATGPKGNAPALPPDSRLLGRGLTHRQKRLYRLVYPQRDESRRRSRKRPVLPANPFPRRRSRTRSAGGWVRMEKEKTRSLWGPCFVPKSSGCGTRTHTRKYSILSRARLPIPPNRRSGARGNTMRERISIGKRKFLDFFPQIPLSTHLALARVHFHRILPP